MRSWLTTPALADTAEGSAQGGAEPPARSVRVTAHKRFYYMRDGGARSGPVSGAELR